MAHKNEKKMNFFLKKIFAIPVPRLLLLLLCLYTATAATAAAPERVLSLENVRTEREYFMWCVVVVVVR